MIVFNFPNSIYKSTIPTRYGKAEINTIVSKKGIFKRYPIVPAKADIP